MLSHRFYTLAVFIPVSKLIKQDFPSVKRSMCSCNIGKFRTDFSLLASEPRQWLFPKWAASMEAAPETFWHALMTVYITADTAGDTELKRMLFEVLQVTIKFLFL